MSAILPRNRPCRPRHHRGRKWRGPRPAIYGGTEVAFSPGHGEHPSGQDTLETCETEENTRITTTNRHNLTNRPVDNELRQVILIQPSGTPFFLRLAEIWRYRELLQFLVWRDITVRYKQTLLGAAWALLQPALTIFILTFFFGHLGLHTGDTPYTLFALAGLLPWMLFAHGLAEVSNSLVSSASLLTKVYFPRFVLLGASAMNGLVDFLIGLVLLLALMSYFGRAPTITLVLLPLFTISILIAAVAIGMTLATLNVKYRDVRYAVPFFVQLGLFVTPVIYSAEAVTTRFDELGVPPWLYGLNPMAGVVEGFRWCVLGGNPPSWHLVIASYSTILISLAFGLAYFGRAEKTLADVV